MEIEMAHYDTLEHAMGARPKQPPPKPQRRSTPSNSSTPNRGSWRQSKNGGSGKRASGDSGGAEDAAESEGLIRATSVVKSDEYYS